MPELIELDGTHLEGGGQIVRTALALSVLTQKPFKITNIRKGRKKPGLKNQHLHAILALQKLCGAKTCGASLGSEELIFHPGSLKQKRNLKIDVQTAGSLTLLLQSLILPCFFLNKGIKLKLKGGTDVQWSMPFDYFNEIFISQIRRYCDAIEVKLHKRGYYPKGGGEIEIEIKTKHDEFDIGELRKENKHIDLMDSGVLMSIRGVSNSSKTLEGVHVSERQAKQAKFVLGKTNVPITITVQYSDTLSTGSVITLWGIFSKGGDDVDYLKPIRVGADVLGEKGKRAEQVGEECANKLLSRIDSKTPVDEHLADNLIPWLAIFGGQIKTSKLSKHTLTNIYTTEKFLGRCFEVDEVNCVVRTIF